MPSYHFQVPGVTCVRCTAPIEENLRRCTQIPVKSAYVSFIEKEACIEIEEGATQLAEEEVINILKTIITETGQDCYYINSRRRIPPKSNIREHVLKGLLGSITGFGLLALSITGFIVPITGTYIIAALASLLTFYLGKETYREAFSKLYRTQTLTMDSLFTVSTLVALSVSIAAFFVPWLTFMFEVPLITLGFRHVGKAIEEAVTEKVVSGLNFRERAPSQVEVLNNENDSASALLPLAEITPGKIIHIQPGQTIPVDGECLNDTAMIETLIQTGNPQACLKKKNELLLAGMKVAYPGQSLKLKVTATEENSYLARLDEDMHNAQLQKAQIQTTADTILQYFIPGVFLLALIPCCCISAPAMAIQTAITILVSACPCILGSIPALAAKVGMSKAANHGVRFKDSKSLQTAAQVDTVVFDMHGTLTTGNPEVTSIEVAAHEDNEEVLALLHAIEREEKHAFAKAISRYTGTQQSTQSLTVNEVDRSIHSGVRAKINNQWYTVGNKHMLQHHGITVDEAETNPADYIVYFARENTVIANIHLNEALRDDAKQLIAHLTDKQIHLCTGAELNTALKVARKLGIPEENVQANCSPILKRSYVDSLQNQGRTVAMVGDGANDAVVMSKANLGIAVLSNSSDEVTRNHAGAVVANASLAPIAAAFNVAKQTIANIKQNLFFSLAYNLIAMFVAGGPFMLTGCAINPGIGVAMMVVQSCLVLLNVYRFKQQAIPPFATDTSAKQGAATNAMESTYHKLQRSGLKPQLGETPEVGVNAVTTALPERNDACHPERSEGTPEFIPELALGAPSLCSG